MRPLPFLLLCGTLAAAPLHAQLVESIEVRVTNVDVVVTDKQGHPVPGLTKDDFELYENRKLQPITNFYEVRPPAVTRTANVAIAPATTETTAVVAAPPEPPQDLRRRRVIFFIDEYSANPIRRNQVVRSMIQQLDSLMKPGDEAMLVSWNRSMHIVEPFTSDAARMRKALTKLEQRGGGGPNIDASKEILKSRISALVEEVRMKRKSASQALVEAFDYVRAYSMEIYSIERNLAQSMGVALTTLAGVDGKKVMVFAGEHMPAHPGAEMFGWAEQQFVSVGLMSSGASQREGNQISLTLAFESVAKQANAAGVTMYMLDSADPLRGVLSSAETNEVSDPISSFVDFTNTAQTFQAIAQLTGGVALTQSSNFDAALQTVAHDLESYYSLGYHPADAQREGNRNLTVKVKNPAYRVRSRRTYVSKSGEEQTSERVVANIFAATSKNDIELRLDAGLPVGSGFHKWRVPVRVTIPAVFTLLPDGDQLAGGFTVFVAVGDDDGAMSNVTKRSQSLKIPAASEAAFRRRPITFEMQVEVNKGEHVLSVAVVDQLTNATGFARTKINGR